MKPQPTLRAYLLGCRSLLAVFFFTNSASAANRYWDGGSVDLAGNGNTASAGGAGTWNTTIKNWDAGAVPFVAWNNAGNDTAIFGGTGGAIALTAPITVGGLTFNAIGYTFASAVPATNFISVATNGLIISAPNTTNLLANVSLAPGNTTWRFQNSNTTNNIANITVLTISKALSGAGTNVVISGSGNSPVYLTGSLTYGGTTTVDAGAVLGLATTALTGLADGSVLAGANSTILRTGGNLNQSFLNKLGVTANSFTIVSNNAGTIATLNLTNFPNVSLAFWDNAATQTFGFNGAITAGAGGYRFGSTRAGNNINIGGTSGTAAVTNNILTGTAGLNLVTGSLGNVFLWGSNNFAGDTLNSAADKVIRINNVLALQNSAIDTSGAGTFILGSGSSGTGGNGGAAITTPTIGGLIGSKDLLTNVIDATGYNSMTSLTLNPGTGATITYSGSIADSTAGLDLAKTGAGTQILSGLNSFTGDVTVSAGTLVAAVVGSGGNSALGLSSNSRTINVNTGGTLRSDVGNLFNNNFASAATSVPALNIAGGTVTNGGAATNSALGNVTLAGGTLTATVGSASGYGSWNLNGTVTSTGASTISTSAAVPITLSAAAGTSTTFDVQSGTLTTSAALGEVTAGGDERTSGLAKIGAGTLLLSGVNTYTGNTVINVGTLTIATKDTLPGYNTNGRYSVAAGATLAVQNGVADSEITAMLATTNFESGANLGFDTTAGSRDLSLNLANTANGSLGVVKLGANTLTLTGTNTYSGVTLVSDGVLALVGGSQVSAITVDTGASLGFTLGSTASSTSSVTFNSESTVTITDTPSLASYTLMTATSFEGIAPELSAPITGYELLVEGTNTLKLVQLDYDEWATLNGAGVNLDDDHDGDSVTNGVEYFIGGPNGNTTGFTPLPGVIETAGTLSITWPKGFGYTGVYGTDFVVETSATLSGVWTTETLGGGNITDTGSNLKYNFPGPLSGKNFSRLKVIGP